MRPGAVGTPVEDTQAATERRVAARALLLHPLLTADGPHAEDFLLVRRHREELERLFAEGVGYRLVVEPKVARLFKAGLGHDATRPLRKRLAAGPGRAFEPRAYALLCLAVAALTRCPAQLLVDELVAQVRSAAADADLSVDLDTVADRRALAAALMALLDLGVLSERDGDLARWAEDATTLSLLDVRRDRLRLLVAASLSGAASPHDLLAEAALPSAAGGARVALRRALLESPVLSVTDLTADQSEWWGRNRHRETDWYRERFGLELELRAEGALAIDPDDELTDLAFPGTGSRQHAALLVLEHLVRDTRDEARAAQLGDRVTRPVSDDQLDAAVKVVAAEHGRAFKKAYADLAVLRADVVELLTGVGLLRPDGTHWQLHGAAARYAAQTAYAEGLF
ncbi:MAG: TIGR02678 family protein [Mycobacteriales bacterium]